jgi:hypothetical protein
MCRIYEITVVHLIVVNAPLKILQAMYEVSLKMSPHCRSVLSLVTQCAYSFSLCS